MTGGFYRRAVGEKGRRIGLGCGLLGLGSEVVRIREGKPTERKMIR